MFTQLWLENSSKRDVRFPNDDVHRQTVYRIRVAVFRLFQIHASIQMQSQFRSKNETYETMMSSYDFVKKKKEKRKRKKESWIIKNDFVMFESFEVVL